MYFCMVLLTTGRHHAAAPRDLNFRAPEYRCGGCLPECKFVLRERVVATAVLRWSFSRQLVFARVRVRVRVRSAAVASVRVV